MCYRLLQDHLTWSVVATRERVMQKMDVGLASWKWLWEHGESPGNLRTCLDLGSGWHPTIPLLFEGFGVKRQLLCDVAPVMTPASFASALAMLQSVIDQGLRPECQYAKAASDAAAGVDEDVASMMLRHGFTYHAPYSGMGRRYPGEVDFITSTQVLPYIEMTRLVECFKDLIEALRPGGWFLATNHLYDMYADADPSISIYKQ